MYMYMLDLLVHVYVYLFIFHFLSFFSLFQLPPLSLFIFLSLISLSPIVSLSLFIFTSPPHPPPLPIIVIFLPKVQLFGTTTLLQGDSYQTTQQYQYTLMYLKSDATLVTLALIMMQL